MHTLTTSAKAHGPLASARSVGFNPAICGVASAQGVYEPGSRRRLLASGRIKANQPVIMAGTGHWYRPNFGAGGIKFFRLLRYWYTCLSVPLIARRAVKHTYHRVMGKRRVAADQAPFLVKTSATDWAPEPFFIAKV